MRAEIVTSVLFSKAVLYSLPGILFLVLLVAQASFHFLTWRKDRNAYVPTGIYSELDPETFKRLGLYRDPLGKYYFENQFLDNLFRGTLGDVSNIRFRRQDNIVRTVLAEPFQALVLTRELFLRNPIIIGANARNEPILCDKSTPKEMLLALEELSLFDLLSIGSRFACDCLGFDLKTFNPAALDRASSLSYQNALLGFLREALNLLKPVKVPTNVDLGFSDFLRFALFTNMTMSSPDLVPRSPGVQRVIPFFTVLSYFLLAVQAATLGFAYQRLIP